MGLAAGMKMFGDELVELVLREVEGFHVAAHGLQGVVVWIGQGPQVGGIHLGVAAEASKILINDGGVQEGVEANG